MTPMCTMDSQCNPPSTVCDTTTGLCAPGCLTTGCPTGQTCNNQTGRCQMGGPMGGNNLNSTCTVNSDCDSRVCFDLGQSFGRRCVQSCGAGAQCPNGYTCYDFNGGRMCLSTQLFSNATFSTPAGGVCTEGGQCKSNFCPAPTAGARMCVETCTEDTDCSGGRCRWYEAVPDRWIGACSGPQGAVPDGSPCTLDTQCASGACINSVCSKLCSSTADCANGQSCAPAEYHECVLPGLSCLLWQANLTTVCVSGPHGSDPVGATCTTFSNCRSGLCHTGINQCSDVCATDADCPSTHRCKILPLRTLTDGTTVNVNVCMPASF